MVDVGPGQLGDVDKAVDAVEVDEAPKSTMFEMVPVTMSPTLSSSMICWRTSLRSSSRTARRDSTTLLRLRFISMTRQDSS